MREFIFAIRVFIVLTLLTGILYPLAVTGIAQAAFKDKANGSLISQDGRLVGSHFIGQAFDDPKYFWSRPSATSPVAYNGAASSGSNLGPTNPALPEAIAGRVKALQDADPSQKAPVPTELVTASGSGLDPHVSIAAAEYQAPRVARLRGKSVEEIKQLIQKHTVGPDLGVLGESVVNVLELNLELDKK
jgi:K+-transporting ATPase ATPase C chain